MTLSVNKAGSQTKDDIKLAGNSNEDIAHLALGWLLRRRVVHDGTASTSTVSSSARTFLGYISSICPPSHSDLQSVLSARGRGKILGYGEERQAAQNCVPSVIVIPLGNLWGTPNKTDRLSSRATIFTQKGRAHTWNFRTHALSSARVSAPRTPKKQSLACRARLDLGCGFIFARGSALFPRVFRDFRTAGARMHAQRSFLPTAVLQATLMHRGRLTCATSNRDGGGQSAGRISNSAMLAPPGRGSVGKAGFCWDVGNLNLGE